MTIVEKIQHPYLRKEIEPRLFQQTILNTCIKNNTLVVLPTGTGKTIISILHIAYLLQKGILKDDGNYILVLAPTKPLVNQHLKSFRSFLELPSSKIIELSGAVAPAKRKGLIDKAMVIIATPQTIRNDLIQDHIDPKKCLLVYFDEAHRARGDYDYVHIADIIHKFNPSSRFVALTASPGTNREDILEICQNLFVETIENRPRSDPEISKYIQEVDIERLEIPLPAEFIEILKTIVDLGEKEVSFLRTRDLTQKNFISFYKGELLKIKKELSRNFRANYLEIMSCNRLMYIQILKEALESQGIPSAHTLIGNWREKNSKSIKGLFNVKEFQDMVNRIEELNNKGIIHPKLLYLLDILDKVDLVNSRVLIFCNLRATCYAISKALKRRGIGALPFVGQGRGKKEGLTQKRQIAILESFRRDEFPVLVSTSVLEEGLDVDECNLVIFYESTPSAIRKIQRSGRTGRKKKGRVIILTTHHSGDTAAHFVSNARERKMNRLLEDMRWLNKEIKKPQIDKRAFAPKTENQATSDKTELVNENPEKQEDVDLGDKLNSFRMASDDMKKWEKDEKDKKKSTKKEADSPVKIIVDSREKNSKILFYLKKEGIDLEFKQLDCGDYILSDRVAIEYKKGEDLLSSIIDGRLFEQLGFITNAYQIPVLLIEGFPTGGIHPEAIAGALSSFMIDFGVNVIQTQNSEETATIIRRIALREQKTKKRRAQIKKAMKMGNPNELAIQVLGSFPGINRTLASRLLETFGTINNVINASIDELKKVEGLGPKKSEKILELANRQFK
ncbi:MAG: DEAD/DEAH box helicase [Asgard group archaeon]|nr:DEAD/DEAH box helicase [Asgard group archaeon]